MAEQNLVIAGQRCRFFLKKNEYLVMSEESSTFVTNIFEELCIDCF